MTVSEAATKKGPNTVVDVVGDVGYKFRKEFDGGWFTGTVVRIRPSAGGGKDRRCVYDDGDVEDLSLFELQTLAISDPDVTKRRPAIGVSSSSSSKGRTRNAPMRQNRTSTHRGVNSDETATYEARGNKSEDTATFRALTHEIEKRRRDDEEEVAELSQGEPRSKRTARRPPEVDEIYGREDGHGDESPASAVAASSDAGGEGAYPNEGNAPDDGNADHDDDNDSRFSEDDDVGRTSVPTRGPPKRLVMKKPSSSSVSTEPPPTKKRQSTTRSRHRCSVSRNTTTITTTAASSVKRKRGTRTILANELLSEEDDEDDDNDEEGLFKVERIVDHRIDEYGKSLYKTRWKGYTAQDDTWEPIANVASTGHVDRYVRLQRQKSLLHGDSAGVAVLEYDDGEREMVDMTIETFRPYRDDEDDDNDNDNVGVNGRGRKTRRKKIIQVMEKEDPTINDYTLLTPGNNIEILWKHANMYFPCKVISWTSLSPRCESGRTTASSFKNDNNNDSTGITPDLVISEELGPPVFVAAEAGLGTGGESCLTMIDLTLSDDEVDASVGASTKSKKDGSLAKFGKYATSLRERPAEMEEEDAPRFVTPQKGTKNKKPTTFDGGNDDSSVSDDDADLFPSNVEGNHFSMLTPSDDDASLFSDVSTPSDDDASLFSDVKSLSGVEVGHLTGNIVSSSSRIYEGNADHDDNDSRFSEDDAGRTSVPTQRPPKKRPKLKKENAESLHEFNVPPVERYEPDAYYFASMWGDRMRVTSCPLSKGLPPPVITRNDEKFRIVFSELIKRKGRGLGEDRMGQMYYKNYYLRVSGGSLPNLSLKSVLLSLGDFETLTYEEGPHKTLARLKLLFSSACRQPGGKEFCFHRVKQDNFEVIDENGHLGCGFIHPEYLVELLGKSKPAQRVYAIQVRFVGPGSVGIGKGMLVVKNDIEKYKIQVPTSMVKVPKSKTKPCHSDVALIIIACFPSKPQECFEKLFNDDPKLTLKQLKKLKPLSEHFKVVLRGKGVNDPVIQSYETKLSQIGSIEEAKHTFKHGTFVGVCDPTGSIPSGQIFLTGLGDLTPPQVLITRHPCTTGKDGVVLKVASQQDMPEDARQFFNMVNYGAVVFPLCEELPPNINNGDLDGDMYSCVWERSILDSMTLDDTDDTSVPGKVLCDDVIGVEFQYMDDGKPCDAIVEQKVGDDLYSVEIKPPNGQRPKKGQKKRKIVFLTLGQIFNGKDFISEVICHKKRTLPHGKRSKSASIGEQTMASVLFLCKWRVSDKNEWISAEDMQKKLNLCRPPNPLKEYVMEKRLLERDILPEKFSKWLSDHMDEEDVCEIISHKCDKNGKIKVLCRFSDGDEQWQTMEDAKDGCKLFLGAYAKKNQLYSQPGWKGVDSFWLKEVQNLMCKGNRSREINNLVYQLCAKYKQALVELGINHNDTEVWGGAWKQSLEIEKHGRVIKLPLHLYNQLTDSCQELVDSEH